MMEAENKVLEEYRFEVELSLRYPAVLIGLQHLGIFLTIGLFILRVET
jgi:hypothetical protein